ncbi:phosphoglycerate kinase [Candidatus Woesearchaeota archaeon]|nr:phosphoglycerate kinase [Candidatus Woesearchaeota archaeon]
MDFKTIKDGDFKGKRVLLRVDFDTPVNKETGEIKDDSRIRISIPTIKTLLEKEAKQLILIWKLGRPKNKESYLKTNKGAERLQELIGENVVKVDGWGENGLPDARIVALENLRFDEREDSKDDELKDARAKELAKLGDAYVFDAFSMAHRNDASVVPIQKYLSSYMGLSVQKEIETIEAAMENPKKPFVSIIGGLKADKMDAIQNMLKKANYILMGGALAFLFLKIKGNEVGDTKIDTEYGYSLPEDVKDNKKIMLPVDAVIADKFDNNANTGIVDVDSIEKGWMALDIGPETISNYKKILRKAKTIVWNGPMGVFEMETFSKGTKELAEFIAELDATTIIGGGDTASAIESSGLADRMSLVSSGGGASLTLLEGKKLVAIEALKENAKNPVK